jgi:hypothetical protein
MSSNGHLAQDYLNLPEDQTGNNFAPMQIPNGDDNNNYHVEISNSDNTALLTTFEFYLPLPNDTVYQVTYTKLRSIDITTLLNNGVDISHIPNSHLPHHQIVQRLINQQIYQRTQQRVYQPQQQSQLYDMIPNSQVDMTTHNSLVYSNNNNIYDNSNKEDMEYNYTTNHNDSY